MILLTSRFTGGPSEQRGPGLTAVGHGGSVMRSSFSVKTATCSTGCPATKAKEYPKMARHAVVIAGGGPTGMMLAAELAVAQVDVVIVERRAAPDPDRARAGGLHARTIEVLDQRGVADRFLEEGKAIDRKSVV